MKFHRLILMSALLGAVAAPWTGAAAATAPAVCQTLIEQARAFRNDPAALKGLYATAERDCDLRISSAIGGALGVALYRKAQDAPSNAARKALLAEAGTYTGRWQITMALGDAHAADKEWSDAALSYQRAINDINEMPGGRAPDADLIRRLVTKANNARAAAPVYVRSLRTRSGAPGGVGATRVGGVEIEAIPFPVEFEFGEAMPTEQGLIALQDMAEILEQIGSGTIHLIGHTDPVGSHAANDRLSLRRAEVVAGVLVEVGVGQNFEIYVEGRGEREDIEIADRDFFSPDEINRMRRRVELVLP